MYSFDADPIRSAGVGVNGLRVGIGVDGYTGQVASIVHELGHLRPCYVTSRTVVGPVLVVARFSGATTSIATDNVIPVEAVSVIVERAARENVGEALSSWRARGLWCRGS
jgi:hypothetical protein